MRKRWIHSLAGLLLLAVLQTSAAFAEPASETFPGSFPLQDLGILSREELTIEINLHGPMLKLVAAFTKKSEPAFSELIANLHEVRVWVAESDTLKVDKVRDRIGDAARWLEDHDWQVIVRTRDGDEENLIYTRNVDGEIVGIAVLVLDRSEAAVINIVGRIDLESVAKLAAVLDIPQLSNLRSGESSSSWPSGDKPDCAPEQD